MLNEIIKHLVENEHCYGSSINMTPSENVLSPLARLPYTLDIYSRYFLDDLRLFGRWFFPSGEAVGNIEREILLPLLLNKAHASFANVRPISGINCMTLLLAALTKPDDTILTVPMAAGGHASTSVVAKRFGLHVKDLPFVNVHDIDLERFGNILKQDKPALVYLDQSTFLFPVNCAPLRVLVDEISPTTLIHFDSSHLNGLILAENILNPLDHGAHIFGGSTHKTLPGPHKGFLATNDEKLASLIQNASDHFVSHHHMADVASLAITLIEMDQCGGSVYAQRVRDNAKLFASTLVDLGVECVAQDRGYTDCHQIWVVPPSSESISTLVDRLKRCHIIANSFNELPGVGQPAFRLSSAEVTRLGATENEIVVLAEVFAGVISNTTPEANLKKRVAELCDVLDRPRYCFQLEDIQGLAELTPEIKQLCCSLFTVKK